MDPKILFFDLTYVIFYLVVQQLLMLSTTIIFSKTQKLCNIINYTVGVVLY